MFDTVESPQPSFTILFLQKRKRRVKKGGERPYGSLYGKKKKGGREKGGKGGRATWAASSFGF